MTRWRPRAKRELLKATAEHFGHSMQVGQRFAAGVRALGSRLLNPGHYEADHRGLRRIPIAYRWFALVRMRGDDVIVLRVLHGRTNPKRWHA